MQLSGSAPDHVMLPITLAKHTHLLQIFLVCRAPFTEHIRLVDSPYSSDEFAELYWHYSFILPGNTQTAPLGIG